MAAPRFKNVYVRFWGEDTDELALIAVGDGQTVFDDNYPELDDRVFFYFDNDDEYRAAFTADPDANFYITKEAP